MFKFTSKMLKAALLVCFLGLGSFALAEPPAIWGVKYRVTQMSVNSTGFISWLKVVNPSSGSKSITANIIWTLADGTEGSVNNVNLGTVDAGGISTISEATILSEMGNPTQLADISMEVIIPSAEAIVVAEKKASDGRLPILTERKYILTDPFVAN